MRKRKISIWELPDYYEYRRIRNKHDNISGYMYSLCNRLSQEERTRLLADYHNTEIVQFHLQFAPEIVKDAIIVYDKCIR